MAGRYDVRLNRLEKQLPKQNEPEYEYDLSGLNDEELRFLERVLTIETSEVTPEMDQRCEEILSRTPRRLKVR